MAAEHEIEELQLQLESKVCGLGVDALAELAEHLQVETKELGKVGIHRVVAGDNFKDGLSFVILARLIESGIKAGYK